MVQIAIMSRKRAHPSFDSEEGSSSDEHPPTPKRRYYKNPFHYCELLGVDAVPKNVPANWCKCHECPTGQIFPEDAICCTNIRESNAALAENWDNFIREYKGCFSKHPKIQNLIKNKEELDSFMIIDGIRKKQIEEAGGDDPIRDYYYPDRQKAYRFACYRKIAMLVHRSFGAENYIQTPACIVEAVRKTYTSPSNQSSTTDDKTRK